MEIKVYMPTNCTMNDVHTHEIHHGNGDHTIIFPFPGGFVVEFTKCRDFIVLKTNLPLEKISDTEYKIPG